MKTRTQAGNALLLILVGITLFAALSYAVSSGLQRGVTIDRDRASLMASQILQYTTGIDDAVLALMSTHGCAAAEISFENTAVTGYTNASAPSDKTCHIFDVGGADLTMQPVSAEALDPAYAANALYGYPLITNRNTISGLATTAQDLVLVVPFLRREVCQALNTRVFPNVSTATAVPYDQSTYDVTKSTGDYDAVAGETIGEFLAGDYDYTGLKDGCFASLSGTSAPSGQTVPNNYSGEYVFYHVLIAR